ncbi:MAG: hypothetical protein ACXWUH_10060 [Burkholderiales bacterium]
MWRQHVYETLGARRADFLERVQKEAGTFGLENELRGSVALSGSQSVRPAFLLPEIVQRIVSASRSPTNLTMYLEGIRDVVKRNYGDEYDAVPVATCEAGLWLCLELFATPPLAGRGEPYRSAYLALHEAYSEHHVSYGRPYPPKYKDIFGERTNTGGELGMMGHRLANLDVVICPVAGARYEPHGIKSFVVPLLTTASAEGTCATVRERAERFGDRVSAIVSLGYDTPGYGYGERSDGAPRLMQGLASIARDFDVPYIIDNARAAPFLGAPLKRIGNDLMLFSMDKVAGAPTSGLIVGRSEYVIQLRRALGWHSDRHGAGKIAYGKGAYSIFDPGRETLVGQLAALEWLERNRDKVETMVDALHAIVREEAAPILARYSGAIRVSKSYNGCGVELNHVDTWQNGRAGIPIFNNEDKASGTNLLIAGLAALGYQAPSAEDGNIFITTGRGLVDETGSLLAERARKAVRAMVRVLEILDDVTQEIARQ